jgi:hypothetical protein
MDLRQVAASGDGYEEGLMEEAGIGLPFFPYIMYGSAFVALLWKMGCPLWALFLISGTMSLAAFVLTLSLKSIMINGIMIILPLAALASLGAGGFLCQPWMLILMMLIMAGITGFSMYRMTKIKEGHSEKIYKMHWFFYILSYVCILFNLFILNPDSNFIWWFFETFIDKRI